MLAARGLSSEWATLVFAAPVTFAGQVTFAVLVTFAGQVTFAVLVTFAAHARQRGP